jgi:alkyl hydroperoxide reductase subunit AhpC
MENPTTPVSVGAHVPDFSMETYEPAKGDFGSISLTELKKAGKWTILVFYPADFTSPNSTLSWRNSAPTSSPFQRIPSSLT